MLGIGTVDSKMAKTTLTLSSLHSAVNPGKQSSRLGLEIKKTLGREDVPILIKF